MNLGIGYWVLNRMAGKERGRRSEDRTAGWKSGWDV